MKSFLLPLLAAVIVLGAVELPKLSRPPFGHHNFRQSQTAATVELFAQEGIEFFRPRTNYVGEPGVLVLEAPIYQTLAALLTRGTPGSLVSARVLNLGFTLLSAAAVWAIVRRRLGPTVAALAATLFLCSPLNQIYMAAVLIDPAAVCFALWAFHFGLRLLEEGGGSGALGAAFLACCLVGGLIKPLYLFPTGIAGLCWLVEHRRLTPRSIAFGVILLISAGAILAWNHAAMMANDASPFTRGLRPTSLLGFSRVADPLFLRRVARFVMFDTLAPMGGLLALTGWGWLVLGWRSLEANRRQLLAITGVGVFGYWFSFANIVYPHEYYSLITVPFCAVAAAIGATLLGEAIVRRLPGCGKASIVAGGIAILGAVVALVRFYSDGGILPTPEAERFGRLTMGRFAHGSFAMIFVSPDHSPGGTPGSEAPAMLYAAGLRGSGYVVADAGQALERWSTLRPLYQHLRYVVFYGVPVPEEIAREGGKVIAEVPAERFKAFELPVLKSAVPP